MRHVSAFVLLSFTSFTLQPLQAVAQVKLEHLRAAQAKVTRAAPLSDDEQYVKLIEDIKETIRRAADKASKHQDTRDEANALRLQKIRLEALEARINDTFVATEADLIAKNLPHEILVRHHAAVAEYRAKQGEFKRQLQSLEEADDRQDESGRASRISSLSTWIDQNQKGKPNAKAVPNKLPFRTPDAKIRAPIESEAGFKSKQALFGIESVYAAATIPDGGVLFPSAVLGPNTPPMPADLAPSEEVQITPAIQAKAVELLNNPVKIHNWVSNTIEYLPTYGSIQGAEMTLQTKRGNAFDTASLEIALLRAAGIPARYVYGTIQMPVERAMNWVGGVARPEAALNLLGQGGIPSIGLVSGGQVSVIKMEHVWVSAYVDYFPSRGAINKNPNTWVPLDPSYKQYAYTKGMDIGSNVPFDATELLLQAQSGATVSQSEGWVRDVNNSNIQNALISYQAQVKKYVDSTQPNATLGDMLGNKRIIKTNHSTLAGTLPYQTLAVGAQMASLPDSLRWKIRLNLYTSEFDRAHQIAQMTVGLNLSAIGTKRLAASYMPSSDVDVQVLKTYESAKKLPLYLVNQTLRVYLDNQKLAEFKPQRMGGDQFWSYTITMPGGEEIEESFKQTSVVGDQIVFGVDGGGLSFEQVADRYATVDPNSSLENLHHLSLGYWARADISDALLAEQYAAVSYRLPSVGMFLQPLSVIYTWGVPRLGSYKSYSIDINRLTLSAINVDGKFPGEYVFQTGIMNSFLEGRVFEEIFDYAPGNGFSAAAVIATAIRNGVPVWKIAAENLQLFLNKSIGSTDVKQEIENAVNAGLVVFSPEQGVDVGFWAGQGYIAVDPTTGSGMYILNSANGGEFSACEESSQPLTQSISQQIFTYTAIALAALIIVGGTTGSGGVGAAPAILIAMRIVGITSLTWSSTSYAAGKCSSSEKCHRGRFQAQGDGLEASQPWAQATPLTVGQARALLLALQASLSPTDLALRAIGFAQALRFVENAATGGGVCAGVSESFPKPPLPKGVRVDIEVRAGTAFVP